METESLTAVQILLLILAANVLLFLSAYGLVTLWRKQSRRTVEKIGTRIQAFDEQMGQLSGFLQSYAGIDKEPYFTLLDALQHEASELRTDVMLFLETCRAFETEINEPQTNQLQAIINAPMVWFRRWRQSAELNRQSLLIAGQITQAEQRMEHIYELPWELASECRLASQEAEEFAQHIDWLQSMNVRGITLQKVASQVAVMQQALNSIPPAYLNATREDLLPAAHMDSTIRVFNILNSVRPALDRHLPQVREWHTYLEKASAEYGGLKQAGISVRQALSTPVTGLDITPLQTRLDQVAQLATEIHQRLSQPDAEHLKTLARDVTHLRKVLEDIEQQYQRAGRQVVELHQSLAQLHEGIGKLAAQITTLEQRENFPLLWDESAGQLQDVRQKIHDLGPLQQPRTPEQITQQNMIIQSLNPIYKNLTEKIPQAAVWHASLIALLENPEIRDGAVWLRGARETLAKTRIYDPKNWSKKEALHELPEELDQLGRLQERLVPNDRSTPVKQTGLEVRLTQTRELASLHKELRPAVENIRSRLEKIQSLENASKERLTGSWSALEKIALLSESNELLDEIIADQIDPLGEEIRQLANELNAHEQGEIEKKAQRIQAHCEKVNQAMNQWLTRLSTVVSEQARAINDRLIQVNAVATLDERPVEDARALVQREDFSNLIRGSTAAPPSQGVVGRVATRIAQLEPKSGLTDLDVIAEIKRKNDLWQTLAAVQLALEEKTAPLLAAHQDVTRTRIESRDRLAEVAKYFPEKRTWPPHNQAPLLESHAIQQTDSKWEAIKKKPANTEAVILELGRLVQQYTLAAERAGQVLDRIQQDHERVQDLEWQIDSLKQRWQTQSDPSNAILREGIQQLISQSDSQLSYIKQQYMRGSLTYEQAIQNLQFLYDEIFSAQVPFDEQTKIGLNESNRRPEKA